jgi:hypothetical protein
MKYKYIKIDISTLAGLQKAENIQAKGYNPIMTGINKIMFEIPEDKTQ